eukprot:Lankesteria_metandrocarpae@DN1129_c0_g1_i1.p1
MGRGQNQTKRASSGRKAKVSGIKGGLASSNPNRAKPDGVKGGAGSHYRSAATIRRLNMYRTKPDEDKMKKQSLEPARIAPSRTLFSNTRTITQDKLTEFREGFQAAQNNPYSVILKRAKLPLSLVKEPETSKASRMRLLGAESFEETFGSKSTRKRPKLQISELKDLSASAENAVETYGEGENDGSVVKDKVEKDVVGAEIFKKGTSRRIWKELYKVVDSSDIIVQVIDARDPMGTRCKHLERYLKKDRPHKYMILLCNKCDLVPTWASARWVKILSSEMPTVAFRASLTNSFGKQALINLLRQYSALLKDKQHVSVGFIGYPNVGKSSVINTLRSKKVCTTAPVPGETRVWQYVSLTNRLHLIDCPGIVPSDPDAQEESSKVLKGVVRAERLETPEDYIDELLSRAKREDILTRYKMGKEVEWENAEEFLTALAKKTGKLRKGGEPDISIAARMVIYDWQRGRIPYFVQPPRASEAVRS